MANARNLSTLAQGASTAGILAGTYGGTGASLSPTTAGNTIFSTDGTNWSSTQKIVQGTAVASTSGTSISFTALPAWVKRITIEFQGVSTSGSSNLLCQLGTGATPTYTTSGYLGSTSSVTTGSTTSAALNSAGYILTIGPAAAYALHGALTLFNFTGNTWVATLAAGRSDAAVSYFGGGSIALGAALTAVRLVATNGTDTFDAGSVNILYE
jgi:hypothetical protein